jgi:hypothetical protein
VGVAGVVVVVVGAGCAAGLAVALGLGDVDGESAARAEETPEVEVSPMIRSPATTPASSRGDDSEFVVEGAT